MIRRPPRSTRTDNSFPTRRSSDLLVSWAASPRDRLRLQVEREVGQLDFEDFVSSPSLTSGTMTAGNKDLEPDRSEEHTSELQSLMRTSYAVFCLQKKIIIQTQRRSNK